MSQALDRSVLDRLRAALDDVSGKFVAGLVAVYGGQAGELVHALEHASLDYDLEGLSSAAHSLKGSSDGVGGRRLAALCLELEHWRGTRSQLSSRVAAVREEVTVLERALATYLSS